MTLEKLWRQHTHQWLPGLQREGEGGMDREFLGRDISFSMLLVTVDTPH